MGELKKLLSAYNSSSLISLNVAGYDQGLG